MTQKGKVTYNEIFEQPDAFKSINENIESMIFTIKEIFDKEKPEEIIFIGCGTSLYLAQTSAAAFSYYNKIPAKAVPCSELIFFPDIYIKDKKVLIVPITRRSDTTEVKMAINKVRKYPNVTTLAVTCDEKSKEYNDYYLLSPNAKESSIVMTKSFTSMVYINVIMSLVVAKRKDLLEKLMKTPEICEKLMNKFDSITKQIVNENKDINLFITLGQGVLYGIACESMNKIKEMSISNSEGYYSLEYRHGPMALADSNTLIILFASDIAEEMEESLMKQMKSFGSKLFIIGDKLSDNMKEYANYYLELECGYNDILKAPIIGIPGQLIGYYAAVNKGFDLDSPRNLSQAIIL